MTKPAPTKVGTTANWTQVSTGNSHTCAVNTAGELYCWGSGGSGQLGQGNTDNRTTPIKVGTTANWTQVSAGSTHTCAVNTAGELYCWGLGLSGQLGQGNTNSATTPTKVGNATNWIQLTTVSNSFFGSATCAVNATGQLHCWGSNSSGQLGLGDTMQRNAPQAVTTPRTPTVAPVLANLLLTGPAGVFGAGNIIAPITFTNTGGDVQPDGCAIDTTSSRPALPAGLRAHPIVSGSNVTCQISGIPTAAAAMATYHLTATNAIGTSEAVTVSFQVDLVRPLLADAPEEQSYLASTAITAQTFTNTGLAVKATGGCTVNPTLPAGLILGTTTVSSKLTCQITGNPSVAAAKATYVITATDANGGTDEARITITVPNPLTDPVLVDIVAEQTYTVGTQIPDLIFTNNGAKVRENCTANPALPEGLTVDILSNPGLSSCQITGTPSEVTATRSYSITVTALIGVNASSDSATVTITVVAAPGG